MDDSDFGYELMLVVEVAQSGFVWGNIPDRLVGQFAVLQYLMSKLHTSGWVDTFGGAMTIGVNVLYIHTYEHMGTSVWVAGVDVVLISVHSATVEHLTVGPAVEVLQNRGNAIPDEVAIRLQVVLCEFVFGVWSIKILVQELPYKRFGGVVFVHMKDMITNKVIMVQVEI